MLKELLSKTSNKSEKRNALCYGFTMTEMAVVFLIAGATLAAIWTATNSVIKERNLNQGISQVWQISKNIRDLYTGQAATNRPTTTAQLVCLSMFPPEILNGTTATPCALRTPINAWNGTIGAGFTAANLDTFFITFNGLNNESCMKLVSYIQPTGQEGAPWEARFLKGAVQSTAMNGVVDASIMNARITATPPVNSDCTGVRFTFNL